MFKWVIQDWMGNRMFPDKTFETFEDGWEFIREQFPEEGDWEELYVVELLDETNVGVEKCSECGRLYKRGDSEPFCGRCSGPKLD